MSATSGKVVALKRSITFKHITVTLISVTGNVAIFIAPAIIAGHVGSIGASLVIWLLGGIINMGLALCFTEMGTLMPVSGGPYAFLQQTWGDFPAFFIVWGYLVVLSGAILAFLCRIAALYITAAIFPGCNSRDLDVSTTLLAACILIVMVVVNCTHVKYVTRVQTLLSSTKLVAMLMVIALGVRRVISERDHGLSSAESLFSGTTKEPGEMALGLFYSLFSYSGWQVVTYFLEEVKEPGRDLPRSIYVGFLCNITLFMLVNLAYFSLIPPHHMTSSEAVALVFVSSVSPALGIFLSVLVATSAMGALNGNLMGHSRLLLAAARRGHMPRLLSTVHIQYLTPWPSLFALMLVSLAMLFSGGVTAMMDFVGLFSTIQSCLVCVALLYLRVKRPDDIRPYKTSILVPVLSIVAGFLVIVMSVVQKPDKMGMALVILCLSAPVYWICVLWKNKPRGVETLMGSITSCAQKVFQLVPTVR